VFQRRKRLENGFGVLWIRTCDPCVHIPLMALNKGLDRANARKQKLLKIELKLEAEVEDGQQLYVSGSVTSLGIWDPELAIPMYPCEEQTNLWQAEIQMPRGTILEYNYFVRTGKVPSDGITWKPGPTLCLSVPSSGRISKKQVTVQDSWLNMARGNISLLPRGASREDIGPPGQPNGFIGLESSSADGLPAGYSAVNIQEISGQLIDVSSGTGSQNICDVPTGLINPIIETQACIEHNGINSGLLRKGVLKRKDPDASRYCKNLDGQKIVYQPLEEPWLPGGYILPKEESKTQNLMVGIKLDGMVIAEAMESESQNLTLATGLDRGVEVAEARESESHNSTLGIGLGGSASVAEAKECFQKELKSEKRTQSLESQAKQEAVGIVLQKKDVVTEIIINSSVCTVQRIAILEDGKPVEILLEPGETNVQVGNIYLGVVEFIYPRMDAALVDIGDTILAFLNIKEPFAFPSFDSLVKENESNGGLANNLGVESSSKEEEDEFHELLKSSAQEEEISMAYEDAKDEEEVIDETLKESDNMGELNNLGIDINNVSSANVEGRNSLNANYGEQCCNEDYGTAKGKKSNSRMQNMNISTSSPPFVEFARNPIKSIDVRKGSKIIVQVIKEGLGEKRPRITTSPSLTSRFWVLLPGSNIVGVSHKIAGVERKRLIQIAETLKPFDCGLTVRTVAAGHSYEKLLKDLTGLMETWKEIIKCAKSAILAAEEGTEGAVPVILHRAMGQTLSVVQNYFNEEVQRMVVDSPHTYHEVTGYLQEFAPSLVNRVELYSEKNPIFDQFGVETEIDSLLSRRVNIPNGGYMIIEQTEALVSIDVNSGKGMLGQEMSKKQPILEVNLAAARQVGGSLFSDRK
ncbi:hypothetical protein KI387_016923, partial [Taxus chinensis]